MYQVSSARRRFALSVGTVVAVVALMLVLASASALGAQEAPGWAVDSYAIPSVFAPTSNEACEASLSSTEPKCGGSYVVTATNVGAASTSRTPVVLKDVLPSGLTVRSVSFHWSGFPVSFGGKAADLAAFGLCTAVPVPSGTPVECTLPPEIFGLSLPAVLPADTLVMRVVVSVDAPSDPRSVMNEAVVEGGGAPVVSSARENSIEGPAAGFGPAVFSAGIYGTDGRPDTQAGGHPYGFSTTIDLNNEFRVPPDSSGSVGDTTVEDVKDVAVDLPLGFVGSALATPTCTFAELSSRISAGVSGCPTDSTVGHIESSPEKGDSVNAGIYNMVPERGVAAEFAFVDSIPGVHVLYAKVVPGPGGYVLRTTVKEIPQVALSRISVTFFGDPAARDGSDNAAVALFTNPSVCDGQPLKTTVYMDSWQHPGALEPGGGPDVSDPNWVSTSDQAPPVTGCNQLAFEPREFHFQPETDETDHATGAAFELEVPQPEDPSTLATPPLKSAIVKLPVGMIVNPAAAGGLASCTLSEVGWVGPGPSAFDNAPPSCPAAAKIGTVSIVSPLIAGTLAGTVYLAAENENPFHSLLAGYIVIDDPTTGILVKIAGKLELDPKTGQITGSFAENPQLPFKSLRLDFFGGARGELATPETCGTYETTASFASWAGASSLESGPLSDVFSLDAGCASRFSPGFLAGTASAQAGSYSTINVSISREDSESDLSGVTVSLPPGLLAKLKGVALCSDAALAAAAANSGLGERNTPSCPAGSKVGTVTAGAGVGAEPFFLTGQAYLAGAYKGAPYSIGVVLPVVAGPFDLGTVVVRQALYVSPSDAHVTDVSDPVPTIVDVRGQDNVIDGFPVRLRRVDVSIDRPEFGVTPTNCTALAAVASFTSSTGQSASATSRYEVGGCHELAFHPKFAATTQARTSRLNGASLKIKVSTGAGEANIGKARVALPRQLPSRLETLHKACLARVFETDRAQCPPASRVGSAKAVTPLLSASLSGPAYLVSHGGEAFPDLVLVLQGNGITLELDGKTHISKGITTSTFNTLPDAPVSSFELVLPEGRASVLGAFLPAKANASMCGQRLTMPTTLTGQNGAAITQNTKIAVSGCPSTKKKHRSATKKTSPGHTHRKK